MNDPLRRGRTLAFIALGVTVLCGATWFSTIRPAQIRRKAAEAEARAKKRAVKKARRPARALVARTGLPNFGRKLAAGEPVTVAFLGGSITQNAGRGGFVNTVPDWLKTRAPGLATTVVNAGLAATGSDRGAERIEQDVLAHRPDLLFVEFAVNDSDRECVADMERIVQKVRAADPQTELVFLYAIMEWTLPRLEKGKYPPSVTRHEMVAERHGIPSVALGFDAARKVRLGEWTWADFSPDACHPTEAGYASYNRDLAAALALLLP